MTDQLRDAIQQECAQILKQSNDNGIILLPTGTGKSRIIVERLKELAARFENPRIIYTCDNTRLRDIDFSNELKKWDAGHLDSIIQKECYAGAYKIKNQEYDIWIGDEFDYMLSPEYSKFALNNRFKHRILVSATLSADKRKMAEKIAPILYERRTFEIEGKGVINKSNHILVNYRLNEEENKTYLRYNERFTQLLNDTTIWAQRQLEILSRDRKLFLSNLASARHFCKGIAIHIHQTKPNARTLIFSKSTEQVDRILPWTYHTANQSEGWLEKFDRGEINFLGVVGKIDRGINLKGVNTIIFEAIDASETKMIQRSGRGKRLDQNELLDVYYLIPYYTSKEEIKPTVVQKWFENATKNIDKTNLQSFTWPTEKTFI